MTTTGPGTDVPYYSQYQSPQLIQEIAAGTRTAADDPQWARSGAASLEEYAFWAPRSCGVACLRMALGFWRAGPPLPAMPLVRELVDARAYEVNDAGTGTGGLIYRPFADYATSRWGLGARVDSDLTEDVIRKEIADGALAILSVHKSIRTLDPAPPSRGGHLVLAVAADERTITIHNPSGLPNVSQKHRVEWGVFDRFFARRGVVLHSR
ncbi:C39 family peptidase [Kitasatospora sp. NPDC057223]|uniref:C39 family peptidase n=1 Tax=Kitasatospora sp. NPDC057223 TaxID=3346055 RepID=UPI003644A151